MSITIPSLLKHIFSIVTLAWPALGTEPNTSTTSVSKVNGSPFGPVASVNVWNCIVSNILLASIANGTAFDTEKFLGDIGLQHSGPHLFSKHSSESIWHGSQSHLQLSWHPQLSSHGLGLHGLHGLGLHGLHGLQSSWHSHLLSVLHPLWWCDFLKPLMSSEFISSVYTSSSFIVDIGWFIILLLFFL